jgi:uncharacterized protein
MTDTAAAATTASASPRPAPLTRRDVTPDLARGFALLGIAIVNAQLIAPHVLVDAADRVGAVVVTLLFENRSWPMFALLFGWGIAAIASRLDAAGVAPRRRNGILVRRNLWLALFGLAQVVLVFWGDILAVYGLTGLVVVALLNRSPRVRVVFGILSVVLWGLATFVGGLGDAVANPPMPDWLLSIPDRLTVFAFWTGSNTILLTHLAPMLVGVALFRLGALHRPAAHLPLLRRLAVWGLIVGLVGAVPLALGVAGALPEDPLLLAGAAALHAVTGVAQGIGYVALIALWSASRTAGAPLRGPLALVAATGKRPLTSYLVHSILLGLLLSDWAVGLAPALTAAGTYALGIAVWLGCATVAGLLGAAHLPGPFDALLRRLAYGPRERRNRQ